MVEWLQWWKMVMVVFITWNPNSMYTSSLSVNSKVMERIDIGGEYHYIISWYSVNTEFVSSNPCMWQICSTPIFINHDCLICFPVEAWNSGFLHQKNLNATKYPIMLKVA